MENTTTEPISKEEAAQQQQKLAELRRYHRDYYDHANTNAQECEHCKNTFSSVSALRRHQVKKNKLKCKLLQATKTIEKLNMSG